MRRFLIALMLALVCAGLICMVASAETSGTCGANGDNLTWTLDDEGVLTICGTGAMAGYGFGSDAPWWGTVIQQAVIDDGVTSIGNFAFYNCSNLTSVKIPSSVSNIGSFAFQGISWNAALYVQCQSTAHAYAANNGNNYILEHDYDNGICTRCGNDTSIVNYGTCGENLTWKLNNENVLTISGTGAMSNFTKAPWGTTVVQAIIPEGVTNIGNSAFSNCGGLTSVTLPESVTSIGDYAFNACNGLTRLAIPEGVTVIGDYAFMSCNGLTSVTIPEGVTSIGHEAFQNMMGNKVFYASCQSVAHTFAANNAISCILIHDVVDGNCTRCGNDASIVNYGMCGDNLTWKLNTDNMMTISGTGDMTNYSMLKGSNFSTTAMSNAPWGNANIEQLNIEGGVTSIGNYAFYNRSKLASVTVSEGVTSIGNYAFQQCYALTSVTILEGVTSIGNNAFAACIRLENVTIPASVSSIGTGAIPTTTTMNTFCNSAGYTYAVNNGIHYVLEHVDDGSGICARCGEDTSIIGSGSCGDDLTWKLNNENVLTISGNGTMTNYDGYQLKSPWGTGVVQAIIEEGVTSVGNAAFNGCGSLTSVTFPDTMISVGQNAFYGCPLKRVTLPDGVTSIGYNAFGYDGSMIHYASFGSETAKALGKSGYSFRLTGDKFSIQYCFDDKEDYSIVTGVMIKNVDVDITSLTIPDYVTKIYAYAFEDCVNLTSVNISENVTEIGNGAFKNCNSLTGVMIPGSVTSIGRFSFEECRSLTSITISEGVTRISENAFAFCSSLTSITIPGTVQEIGEEAFFSCINLETLEIAEGVMSIERYAFQFCNSLTSVTIPSSVSSIGGAAFCDCGNLENATVPATVTEIGSAAFPHTTVIHTPCMSAAHEFATSYGARYVLTHDYNDGDTCIRCGKEQGAPDQNTPEFIISDGVLTAYTGDGGAVTIPDDVTSIGGGSFVNCTRLTSVTIPEGVMSIGESAFCYCSSLTSVTIPDSMISIGEDAFFDCSSLVSVTIPDGMTSIGEAAFRYCSSLTSVTIPNSVTNIGNSAFDNTMTIHTPCTSAAHMYAVENDLEYELEHDWGEVGYAWADDYSTVTATRTCKRDAVHEERETALCADVALAKAPTETEKGERTYTSAAFNGDGFQVQQITVADIPAFKNMDVLYLPASLTEIEDEAFSGLACQAVTISDGCVSIGTRAFADCENLIYVRIPASVTNIAADAFAGCDQAVIDRAGE